MSKIGVIIGRFQVPELHTGHIELIKEVAKESDKILFILGEARVPLTANNPLPFESRSVMIVDNLMAINLAPMLIWPILQLKDRKDDAEWSKNLDTLIAVNTKETDQVTLYSGRDGFNVSYSGKYPVNFIKQKEEHLTGTEHRVWSSKSIGHSKAWRKGVIFATQNRYPTSYQATDAAILKRETGEILLGRKPAEKKFRVVGGFVDPSDLSLEAASKREVTEESSGIEVDNFQYICSYRVKDWRFEHEKDKIMTAFFACNYIFGSPKASDDIAEVKWFKLNELTQNMIEPEHIPLLIALKEYVEKENEKIELVGLVTNSLKEGDPVKNQELISKLEKALRIVRQPVSA